jgi:hypothetical protein
MRKLSDRLEFDQLSEGGHRVRMAVRMQSKGRMGQSEAHLAAGNRA